MSFQLPLGRVTSVLFALALLASACQQQDQAAGTGTDSTASAAGGAQGGADSPNVAFIDSMVPHHEMSIHMADMVIENGATPEVKQLAQQSRDKQAAEVTQMKAARQELAGSDATPAMSMDPNMQTMMDSMMAMRGQQLDAMFVQHMIPHHRQGIQMAQQAKPDLTRPDLQTLAQKIADDQQREIQELERLQAQLPAANHSGH